MTQWDIQYTDLQGNKTIEHFGSSKDAMVRYEALLPRTYGSLGDLECVCPPKEVTVKPCESVRTEETSYDWDDFKSVVRRAMVGTEMSPKGKHFYVEDGSGVKTVCSSDGTPLVGIKMDYSMNTGFGDIKIINMHLDAIDFDKAFEYCQEAADYIVASLGADDEIAIIKVNLNEDGASAASLGACPTGARRKDAVNEDTSSLEAAYGDGNIYTMESSADGFYGKNSPLAMAVLNNDIETMKSLQDGTVPTPDKPWKYSGWVEDIDAPEDADGNYPYVYDMDVDYDLTFVQDFHRVIGEKDNEEALNLLLDYYPDFFVASIDFNNAFHKGYSKGLLRTLLSNIRAAIGDDEDLSNNYLAYEEFGDDPIKNLTEFLGE